MTQTGTKAPRPLIVPQEEHRTSRRTLIGGAGGTAALALLGGFGRTAMAQTPVAEPVTEQSGLLVFPRHGTRTASPGTEISFRGDVIDHLGTVEVVGSITGGHSGMIVPHSDGMGASFVPDSPFQPNEWVTIRAEVPLRPTPSGSVTFRVSVPGVPVSTPTERERDQPEQEPQQFHSRLDLLPPSITMTESSNRVAPGFVFLGANVDDGQRGAMILDNRGEIVWFNPLDLDVAVNNDVRVQRYKGEPVLTMWEGIPQKGTGFGHVVLLDQHYEVITRVQVANGYPGVDQHECLITEHDTLLIIVYNPVRWDLSSVGGPVDGTILDNVIQELDIATGRMLFEWHALDHIALDEAYGKVSLDERWDYAHINSVEPYGENFVVSARHTHAVYHIDRALGSILWRLNGKHSDFDMEIGSDFAYQHDARVHADGTLSLFDNHESNQDANAESWSRGLVFDLDEQQQTASVVREFVHPTEILSVSQGNLQVLDNGNAFVGWGSAPVFTEFDPEGEVVLNGRLPQGASSYRAYRCDWEGFPLTQPAIAIETGLGDNITVHVSWNGATNVRNWVVLTGSDPNSLGVHTTSFRTGFETSISTTSADPYLAVQALGVDGNVLGVSEVAQVR